jgi:DHA1 family multidrug resistance protein-like MFS transporter
MNAFAAIVFASLLSRLGYQMARSPVLPAFAADLGALPEFIGVIVAASTVTGVFFKLPSGALSDVLGRNWMMVLGVLFFAVPQFLYPFVGNPWSLLSLRFVHGFSTAISRRSLRPMSRASPRPGATRVSAGSPRETISVERPGR